MMTTRLLSLAILTISVTAPSTAVAYTTPEEALNTGDFSLQYVDPPPNKRTVQEAAAAQQERSAQRRTEEQEGLFATDEPEEDTLHGAAPDDGGLSQEELQELLDAIEELQDGGESAQDARDARILERIEDRQDAAAYAATIGDETLHSGAPLSETGPGTLLGVLLLFGTAAFVMRKAKGM